MLHVLPFAHRRSDGKLLYVRNFSAKTSIRNDFFLPSYGSTFCEFGSRSRFSYTKLNDLMHFDKVVRRRFSSVCSTSICTKRCDYMASTSSRWWNFHTAFILRVGIFDGWLMQFLESIWIPYRYVTPRELHIEETCV